MPSPTDNRIVLVEGDPSLDYLLERYTERSGLSIEVVPDPPPPAAIADRPAAVWFPSLDSLARWRSHAMPLLEVEPAVIVCTTVHDELRARELGADYCAVLPLTYEDFRAAIGAVGLPAGASTPSAWRVE